MLLHFQSLASMWAEATGPSQVFSNCSRSLGVERSMPKGMVLVCPPSTGNPQTSLLPSPAGRAGVVPAEQFILWFEQPLLRREGSVWPHGPRTLMSRSSPDSFYLEINHCVPISSDPSGSPQTGFYSLFHRPSLSLFF